MMDKKDYDHVQGFFSEEIYILGGNELEKWMEVHANCTKGCACAAPCPCRGMAKCEILE